jgi:hypothetical protein
MSTKIYRAYRLKRSQDLWPLVHDIRLKGTRAVKKVLTNLLLNLAQEVDPLSEEYGIVEVARKNPEVLDRSVRLEVADHFLTNRYREESVSHLRSPWCFDVAVGIRQYKGRLYLIPYCDELVRSTLDFLDRDPRLEDFH